MTAVSNGLRDSDVEGDEEGVVQLYRQAAGG